MDNDEDSFIGEKNVQRVEQIIKTYNLKAEIIRTDEPITSLESHLNRFGGTAEQVLKCLCMVSEGKPLVVMASGEIRIDTKKLSKISGLKDIRMARSEELEPLFGRIPGGVDALTIAKVIPLFADEKLFEKEWVLGSAGSPYAGLKLNPKEILKVQQPIIADLAKGN